MNEIQQNIGAWMASVVLGSGGTLAVAWWALRGRLSEIFLTREDAEARRQIHAADMEGLRRHVDEEFATVDRTMEGLGRRTHKTAGDIAIERARLDVLAERVSGHIGRLEDMHTTIQRMESKVDSVSSTQATIAQAVRGLTSAVESLRQDLRGHDHR